MKNIYLYIFLFLLKINLLQAQTQDSLAIKAEEKSTIIISDGVPTQEELKIMKEELKVMKEELKVIKEDKSEKAEKIKVIREQTPRSTTPKETVSPEDKVHYKEVSLNMTSLFSRLAPFGDGIPLAGPTTLYLKKYNGRRAFRFGLSLQSSSDAIFANTVIRLGVEKRKPLNTHWAFTRATDFIWAFGSFDTPGFGRNSETRAIGAGLAYGVEYVINKNISLSTEATVFLGLGGSSGLNFKIIPPIALYLNVKLFE